VKLPVLYRLDAHGALQQWEIVTRGNAVHMRWGQYGGLLQTTVDQKRGKNIGRSNETTPEKQAESEARSLWKKKIDAGYTEDKEKAAAGVDDVGLLKPMTAHVYQEFHHKVSDTGLYVSPKLDGQRCMAVIDGFDVTLYSRNRKPITSVPHIERWLSTHVGKEGHKVILDGEIYNHRLRVDYGFEKIQEIVMRKKDQHPEHESMQFHVFDMVKDSPYYDRIIFAGMHTGKPPAPVVLVKSIEATKEELPALLQRVLAKGYEGLIIRDPQGMYEAGRRSYKMLKLKDHFDAEFDILGVVEGTGKLTGHAGSLICITAAGEQFQCKLIGSEKRLRDIFNDSSLWEGHQATVRYQNLTETGVPRFPRAIKLIKKGEKL
jgi:DNA ligase 1